MGGTYILAQYENMYWIVVLGNWRVVFTGGVGILGRTPKEPSKRRVVGEL
jgi:hypothetical protein